MWKRFLKLRPLAATFLKSKVRNGSSTHFWFDNWLDVGPLIEIFGEGGTRMLGVRRDAKISEVGNENGWRIRRCRGVHLQETLR